MKRLLPILAPIVLAYLGKQLSKGSAPTGRGVRTAAAAAGSATS